MMQAESAAARAVQRFQNTYGEQPAWLARAPGRVNIIGDHTDYNEGFVLPMAIDRDVCVALRPRHDNVVSVYSTDFAEQLQFDLADEQTTESGWLRYVHAVARSLQSDGYTLRGWDGVIAGDVPVGAGLSSSAALELAVARAFASVSDLGWDPAQMALRAQRAENVWVGMNCGIMDQMISAAGEAGSALLIDCRSLQTRAVPLPAKTSIVVLDTATRRELVDSEYNARRRSCEEAAAQFAVRALRDVDEKMFAARAHELSPITRMRARHVVTENARTLRAADALAHGDAERVGQLMNASHDSLRDDFEVSRPELNLMVEIAQQEAGCFGARMTGAGFGGCAVALVADAAVQRFLADVADTYKNTTGREPALYVCHAVAGASIVSPQEATRLQH